MWIKAAGFKCLFAFLTFNLRSFLNLLLFLQTVAAKKRLAIGTFDRVMKKFLTDLAG